MFRLNRMQILCIMLVCSMCFVSVVPVDAGQDEMLQIDGIGYTVDDFKLWWERYREDTDEHIASIDPYIDWLLLNREAKLMELDSLAEYRRKIDVYNNFRSLLLLKNEEIDSKISISDDDLYVEYLAEYAPIKLIALIECQSQSAAERLGNYAEKENTASLAKYIENKSLDYVMHTPQWMRPNTTPSSWKSILKDVKSNDLSGYFQLDDNKFGVLYVINESLANDQDFMNKKKDIAYQLRKKLEARLTANLIEKLKKKYNVTVYNDIIDSIDLFAPTDPEKIAIRSDKSIVTVAYLVEQCFKDKAIMKKVNRQDQKALHDIKYRTVNAMISNSLTTWESLDRHYENDPPFKWDMEFYKNHRLVKEIEKRLFGDISVNQDDVRNYYEDHLQNYEQPERAQVVLLQGERNEIFKVWTKVLAGGDMVEEAENIGVPVSMGPEMSLPVNHFPEETHAILKSLNDGDISSPYTEDNLTKVVKLIARTKSRVEPLEKVKNDIITMLLERKKKQKRAEFIDTIKAKSIITTHTENWQRFMAEDNH